MRYIFVTIESLYYFWRFRRAHRNQKVPFHDLISMAYRPRSVGVVYTTRHLSWALRVLRHASSMLNDKNHCLLVSLALLSLCHSEVCMFIGARDFKSRPGDLHAWIVYHGQVFTTDQELPQAILVEYPKPFTGDRDSASQFFEF